jgi:hypothetical protein
MMSWLGLKVICSEQAGSERLTITVKITSVYKIFI